MVSPVDLQASHRSASLSFSGVLVTPRRAARGLQVGRGRLGCCPDHWLAVAPSTAGTCPREGARSSPSRAGRLTEPLTHARAVDRQVGRSTGELQPSLGAGVAWRREVLAGRWWGRVVADVVLLRLVVVACWPRPRRACTPPGSPRFQRSFSTGAPIRRPRPPPIQPPATGPSTARRPRPAPGGRPHDPPDPTRRSAWRHDVAAWGRSSSASSSSSRPSFQPSPPTSRARSRPACWAAPGGCCHPRSPIHRWSSAAGDPTGDHPGRHRYPALSWVFRSRSRGLQIRARSCSAPPPTPRPGPG